MEYQRSLPNHPKQVDLIASTDNILARIRREKKLKAIQLEAETTPPHQLNS